VDSETLSANASRAPNCPFIGEEIGGDASLLGRDEPYWAVDPLDGTYNYCAAFPAVA